MRLYERLGFRTVGRVRGALLLNGNRHDLVIMDLLRSELEPLHTGRFRALEGEPGAPQR
jgi:RimJ/RimL family protein N-acetyltransferase